jgi:hypothetical protein
MARDLNNSDQSFGFPFPVSAPVNSMLRLMQGDMNRFSHVMVDENPFTPMPPSHPP